MHLQDIPFPSITLVLTLNASFSPIPPVIRQPIHHPLPMHPTIHSNLMKTIDHESDDRFAYLPLLNAPIDDSEVDDSDTETVFEHVRPSSPLGSRSSNAESLKDNTHRALLKFLATLKQCVFIVHRT